MKPSIVLCAALLLGQSIALTLQAQTVYSYGGDHNSELWLGGELGVSQNFHTGGFRTADCACPVFEGGRAMGFSIGAVARFPIGRSGGLMPRLSLESRPGDFHVVSSNPATQPFAWASAEVTYLQLTADALYQQQIATISSDIGVLVAAGLSISHVLRGSEQRLLEGSDEVLVNDVIPGLNRTAFGLRGGFTVDIPMADMFHLVPGLYYHLGLTDVTRNENWQVSAVDFRVALMMGIPMRWNTQWD